MLERLGLYGLEKIEDAILAGLVTGDPVLLIGSHGSGKTLLCSRLAQTLGLRFWAYDASKALFEDVLGFPDPASLSRGQVEYVPTPISIWGKEFVLIDELSRANPSMQNKWLEIIRSRRVMGKNIEGLKYIFAAMNPPSYLGAHPLDPALAGRFAVIVQVPEVSEMPEDSVRRILRQLSEDDAPMLKAKRRAPQGLDLHAFLEACRQRMMSFDQRFRQRLSQYVISVNQFLQSREFGLDGRRLGMIWRSLQAFLAVGLEKKTALKQNSLPPGARGSLDLTQFQHLLAEGLSFTVPFPALAEKASEPLLRGAHHHALSVLNGTRRAKVFVMAADAGKAVHDFARLCPQLEREERKASITRFLTNLRTAKEPEKLAPALLAVFDLAHLVCTGELSLEPEDAYRLLSAAQKAITAEGLIAHKLLFTLQEVVQDNLRFDPRDPLALLSFRAGFLTEEDDPRPWRCRPQPLQVIKKALELKNLIHQRGGQK